LFIGTATLGRKPTLATAIPVQPILQGFRQHLIQHMPPALYLFASDLPEMPKRNVGQASLYLPNITGNLRVAVFILGYTHYSDKGRQRNE
jgi:hypothetical protein